MSEISESKDLAELLLQIRRGEERRIELEKTIGGKFTVFLEQFQALRRTLIVSWNGSIKVDNDVRSFCQRYSSDALELREQTPIGSLPAPPSLPASYADESSVLNWLSAFQVWVENAITVLDSSNACQSSGHGIKKSKLKGGRQPLVKTNPQSVNLYDLVLLEWRKGRPWDEIIGALLTKNDVKELAKGLKEEIDKNLIKKAKRYRNAHPKK